MKLTISLKRFLIFSFSIVVTLTIFIISFVTVHSYAKNLEEEITNKNLVLARSLVGEVEALLNESGTVLAQIADMTENQKIVAEPNINNYLTSVIKNYYFFDMIEIINDHGIVTHVAPRKSDCLGMDMSAQQFYQVTHQSRQNYWSSMLISLQTGQPTIVISRPLQKGMVVGYLNLARVVDITDRVTLGSDSWVAILDQNGTLIAHTDRALVYQHSNIRNNPGVKKGLAGKPGVIRYDESGKPLLAIVSIIPETSWPVVITQSLNEAFTPLVYARNFFIGGIIVALFLAISFAIWSLRQIVGPLSELANQANQVACGNYETQWPLGRYREFNLLAEDFNIMANAVQFREIELKEALSEKEILLKEVHHRVKNNFQVISSLLRLQSDTIQDPKLYNLFKETRHRIRSMSLVHERLYASTGLTRIDFYEYVETLVKALFQSYGIQSDQFITYQIEMKDIQFGIDHTIACGMIINELVSNALKYAFVGRETGNILIRVKKSDNLYQLVVKDDGVGMPVLIELKEAETLGLQLVVTLVDELHGSITVNRDCGTEFIVEFQEVGA